MDLGLGGFVFHKIELGDKVGGWRGNLPHVKLEVHSISLQKF